MKNVIYVICILFILSLFLGCSSKERQNFEGFKFTELNGGELAALLKTPFCKYTYDGPDRFCHWRVSAKLYGPDDKVLSDTFLGEGRSQLVKGRGFMCLIPVYEGGNSVIHFCGQVIDTKIAPLLPLGEQKSRGLQSRSWNSTITYKEGEPIILGIFSANTDHLIGGGITNIVPKGHGGSVLIIALELNKRSLGGSYP